MSSFYDFFLPDHGFVGSILADPTAPIMTLTATPVYDGAGPRYPLTSGTPLSLTPSVGPATARRGNSYLGAVLASQGLPMACTVDYTAGSCPTLTCGDLHVQAVGPAGDQVCPSSNTNKSQWLENVLLSYPGVDCK